MNSTSKGDGLEDAFYQYLRDQQDRGEYVYDAYPPENCQIYKKRKYYYSDRKAYVEFDIVIEFRRRGRKDPHLYVIFECKNHKGSIKEIYVNDFLLKIGSVFPNNCKGIMVVTSKLQSGAEQVARSKNIGIVKYDQNGFETIADRKGSYIEKDFVRSQLLENDNSVKSLKFSAFCNGQYFSSSDHLIRSLDPEFRGCAPYESIGLSVPFISTEKLKEAAAWVLALIGYESGPVDLQQICRSLSIDLQFSDQSVVDADGNPVLGTANFGRRTIQINSHSNKLRQRFTIAHEIGHFCLDHERYLRSDTIIERDLFVTGDELNAFNYERLELQANAFSAELILPESEFLSKTAEFRHQLCMEDRGHGYIFVDDQPCNYQPYNVLVQMLSSHFEVSKQVIEIKFIKFGFLRDQRGKNNVSRAHQLLHGPSSSREF